MKLRRSRLVKKGRIEIIPMIDVMFFLLATFMLASLSMQNLHSLPINLPQGHAAPMPVQAKNTVTLTVTQEGKLFLDKTPVTMDKLALTLMPMLNGTDSNVIVAADSAATNGVTIKAMLKAREAGVQHFLIAVKHVD
jgi:biopolymer transport protein ExbD